MTQATGRLTAALFAAVLVSTLVVFGSLSGTSGATTVDVSTEAEYRDALDDLSVDPSGPHTINVLANITLAGSASPAYSGDQDLTINGNGHTISGADNSPILTTSEAAAAITFTDIRLEDGNHGIFGGGAVDAAGPVTVRDSALVGNTAGGLGGAVLSGEGIEITGSTLSGNTTPEVGGAVATETGDVEIEGSTLDGNTAGDIGGAVFAEGSLSLVNTTLSGNSAGDNGGAVFVTVDASFTHVTVAGNTAPSNANIRVTGDLTSFGSVVADPQGGANCGIGGDTTSTYSYDDDGSCGFTDGTDTSDGPDPQLGPLANNGGPTQTMLPQPGSPLIDAIAEADCHDEVITDQRGVSRPQDGDDDGVFACDIGAVEVEPETAGPARPVERDPTFTG